MPAVQTSTLSQIALDVIQPLCDETRRMFNAIRINETDRILLGLHKDKNQFHVEFYSISTINPGAKYAPSYAAHVRFAMVVPDRQKLSEVKWLFSATDITALLISYHWKPYQIQFVDNSAEAMYRYLLARFVQQTKRVKSRNEIDSFQFQDSKSFPLLPYQKRALKGCLNSEGFGLFMEQGTGKTAVAIARMCNEAIKKDSIYRTLIICPKAVRENWKSEIKKFATVPGKTVVVRGGELDRIKNLIDAMSAARNEYNRYSAAIISMDSVGNTEQALQMVPWDLCILDESHGIKNPSTKRWKSLQKLRDNCKSRMVLTGTPITNTLFDLWSQFEFMGEGYSGFSSFQKFKAFYGQFEQATTSKAGYQKLVGLTNVPIIQERLARQAFLIKKSEALPDLPPKTYDIYEVEMSEEQSTIYRQLCATLMAEFESMLAEANGKKDILIVNNILTQMLRLAQVTSGFVGIPEMTDELGNITQFKKINRFDPNPKIEACVEILKEKEEHQKTIIWTNWVPIIKTLKARLDYEKINSVTFFGDTSDHDRNEAVYRFNCDPTCKVLIGNPRAGGVGLNLLGYDYSNNTYHNGSMPPTYCDHVIYFSQNWSAVDRSQSEDRPHRRGTVSHVRYTDLVVPATIDEEIRERVLDKRLSALRIQDIRDVISRIMKG